MTDDGDKDLRSAIQTRKRRNKYAPMLSEWYGGGSAGAMMKYLPESQDLSDVLAGVTKNLVPPWMLALETVNSHWQEIVGPAGAKYLTPVRFDGTTLLLELKHPAYRMTFDTPAVKTAMIRKINERAGTEICKAVKFVAAGMFAKK